MKSRNFQKRLFSACIEIIDHNIVSTFPYLLLIILEALIKGTFGVAYIFHYTGSGSIQFLQNQNVIANLTFVVAAYIILIFSMLLTVVLSEGHQQNFIRSTICKTLIVCLKINNTFLMVPIQVVIFQCFRLALLTQLNQVIQVYHLALAILSLFFQISLYLFTENFIFCFFPNKQIPWSKPSASLDFIKFLNNVTYSIMLIFDHSSQAIYIILFIFTTILQLFSFLFNFFQIPYYNMLVDSVIVSQGLTLSYIYAFAALKAIFSNDKGKASFDVVFAVTLVMLVLTFYKIRKQQVQQTFLKPVKSIKDFKIQIVELIRLSSVNQIDLVISLQGWIIQHKQACGMVSCQCTQFRLNEIQNINSRIFNHEFQQEQDDEIELDAEENTQKSRIVHQEISLLSPLQQEFYMSQFLNDTDILMSQNPNEYEKRQLLKLQSTVIQLINSEIEGNGQNDTQLQFLQICIDIFLKSQSYRAFFKILQIQSSGLKLTMKQQFILAYLKKYLINKMNLKEKYKKNSEKITIQNQLKFERSFQKFILDITKISDMVDILWKQSASRNYKIIPMIDLIDKINQDYMRIWYFYQEIEDKFQNAELLIVLSRFCDLVMGFELEAESFQQKASSLLNSLKLQHSKGQILEEGVENKIKSQELIFNVQCSPKCLDRIEFANSKFLLFSGYKLEDIPNIKVMQPHIIAINHDEKILNFLQRIGKTSSKVILDTWLKVKQGYVVPVIIQTIPMISIKHDLRFITLVSPKRDFELDDNKYFYNQVFIFLVNGFGRIDSATEICQNYLNVGPKMIDNGLTLSQIFLGLDYDKITEVENGQIYKLDKKNILGIQNQLDLQQETNLSSKAIQQREGIKHFLSGKSPEIFMRIYIKANCVLNPDQTFYEVYALPLHSTEQSSVNQYNLRNLVSFQSSNMKIMDQIELGQKVTSDQDVQDYSFLGGDDGGQDFGSQSSITSSQTSKSDKQFQLIRDIKEITQIKDVPPLIIKLRRALNVFFFVMLITAIVLLIVNIVDKISFKQDIQAVEQVFRIQYYISNVRLRFLYLFSQSNYPPPYPTANIQDYQIVQYQLGVFVENFRLTINKLGLAVQLLSDSLKGLFFDNIVLMNEVSKAGVLYNTTNSFQGGCQEVIVKADQYKQSDYSALKINRSIFGIQYGASSTSNYSLTQDEINGYYITQNLAETLKLWGNTIQSDFSTEVENFGNQSQQNILIFTLVCVIVVVISGFLLMPMLFTIDNALRESIKTWTQIRQQQKEEQLNRIAVFKEFLTLTDFSQSSSNNRSQKNNELGLTKQRMNEGYNTTQFMEDPDLQKNDHNQKTKNSLPSYSPSMISKSQNNYLKNINFREDLVDDDNEEIKKPEQNLNQKNHNFNNSQRFEKVAMFASSQYSFGQGNINRGLKMGAKESIKNIDKIHEQISESDEDEEEKVQPNHHRKKKVDQKVRDKDIHLAEEQSEYHETDVERIHRLSQIISLGKYTFTRKIRMSTVIMTFIFCLCAMYVGSYLLASKIYDQTLQNFNILTVVSNRSPCMPRCLYFLMDQYIHNTTGNNQPSTEVVSSLLDNCNNIESQILQLQKNNQLSQDLVKAAIDQLESSRFCDFYLSTIAPDYAQNSTQANFLYAQCQNISSGLMNLGLSSVMSSMYHYIQQQNIFYQTMNRTTKSLQSMLYDKNFQIMLQIYFDYVGPALDSLEKLTNQSLYDVLEQTFGNVIVMFTIFIFFLLITWFISLKMLINSLSKTLSWSRISVKMIPAQILIEIKERASAQMIGIRKIYNEEAKERDRQGKKQVKFEKNSDLKGNHKQRNKVYD